MGALQIIETHAQADRSAAKVVDISLAASRDWGALSRGDRMAQFGDMAFEIVCRQIQRDYASFFKRHVLTRLDRDERPALKDSSVLIALSSLGGALTGADIAHALRARPSTISRSLAALEDREWVSTAPCEHDSRATCNLLTEEGRRITDSLMHYWAIAVAKAEMLTGSHVDRETFARWSAVMHTVKDRAFAYREFKPGRLNVYRHGMSRPEPARRHDASRSFALRDSYLRFYALAAHRDYQDCLNRRAIKPALAGSGLTVRELRVLMCVDFYQTGLSQSEVASTLRMDTATVARATQILAERGWVDLREDDEDSRLCLVSLSSGGQRLAERYRAHCLTLSERIESQYDLHTTREEMAQLMKTLVDIRDRAARFADLKVLPKADPEV